MWSPMKDPNSNQTVPPALTEAMVRKPIQRWSAARKRDVVLRLLRGESIEAVSRQVAVEPYQLEQWAIEPLPRSTPGSKTAPRMIRCRLGWAPPTSARANSDGKRTAAREDCPPGGRRAFSPGEVSQMSAAISPATSQSYGVQRVCCIWGLPRSSFYRAVRGVPAAQSAARRGPVPPVAGQSAGRDPSRSRGLAVPRRGAPQGLGSTAFSPPAGGRPQPGVAADAREPTTLALSIPSASRQRPYRHYPDHRT
jgi:hypothetical protein